METLALKILGVMVIGHCLFMAAALWSFNTILSNRLLSLLMVLLAIRVGKSIAFLMLPVVAYPLGATGVVAMAITGPVLLILMRSFFTSEAFKRVDLLHFTPVALCLPAFLIVDWKWLNILYFMFTTHMAVYVFLSVYFLWKNRDSFKSDNLRWLWAVRILSGVFFIWITCLLQILVYDKVFYASNIVVSAVILYFLTFIAFRSARLFSSPVKKKSEESDVLTETGIRIQRLFEQDEIYINPELTVTLLATKIGSPAYLVSKAVNHHFKMTFSELLSRYRLRKAEDLLINKGAVLSIEGISCESGFNSLSSFYTAFKKAHQMTPAQFRKQKGGADMKVA